MFLHLTFIPASLSLPQVRVFLNSQKLIYFLNYSLWLYPCTGQDVEVFWVASSWYAHSEQTATWLSLSESDASESPPQPRTWHKLPQLSWGHQEWAGPLEPMLQGRELPWNNPSLWQLRDHLYFKLLHTPLFSHGFQVSMDTEEKRVHTTLSFRMLGKPWPQCTPQTLPACLVFLAPRVLRWRGIWDMHSNHHLPPIFSSSYSQHDEHSVMIG